MIPQGSKVESFVMPDLKKAEAKSYSKIKQTFQEEAHGSGRFMLSDLVANQMTVEEEEQLRFMKKVNETVDARIRLETEDARKIGYEEGFKKGQAQAYEEEKARLATQIERLGLLMQSLTQAKLSMAEQYEKALLETAFRIAKIIVLKEVTERPEVIARTVADILGRISKDDDVLIRLAPEEFDVIEKIQEDLKQIARTGRLSFEVDQRMVPGSCIVESMSGEIASDIESKFVKLQEDVIGGLGRQRRVVNS